jgi:RNA polymerase sigma-70 factor (ECF subfamily)
MARDSGERSEFRQLFETHADGVYRYLYRLARNRHDAEDLLQETFVRLWRKRGQFRGDGSFAGYVRRIAYRTYLNARARLARGNGSVPIRAAQEPPDDRNGPAEQAGRADLERFLLMRVREAVDALPDSLREPFVLFRYEGLMLKEIASILGISTKAVENRVARALKRVAGKVAHLRTEWRGR